MYEKFVSRFLDKPFIYKLSEAITTPGGNNAIVAEFRKIIKTLPKSEKILDVGCGPESWLSKLGLNPVGLDISKKYIESFNKKGGNHGMVGTADEIPCNKDSFDSVWTIGLFHHLPDNIVKSSIKEMVRVCQNESHIIIFDAVLPRAPWRRPIAWLIRKADRGRYMRHENQLVSLIPENYKIINKYRFTYSYFGHEALIVIIQK